MKARVAPTQIDLREWLSVEEVALRGKVSVATVWRWRKNGKLSPQKILGRTLFRRDDVEKALGK
jgi:excisionase family DNA binding protein